MDRKNHSPPAAFFLWVPLSGLRYTESDIDFRQGEEYVPSSIIAIVQRWKAGDEEAQHDLESRLQPFLLQLLRGVRRRIAPQLKARIDSEAIIFAALHSFLTGVRKDEFPTLKSQVNVKKLLKTLVIRTLKDEIAWHQRQRRTPEREESHEVGQPTSVPAPPELVADVGAWLEELETVVRPVHEKAMEIIELSVKGFSNVEIAEQLSLSPRFVQVQKRRMIERWEADG